MFDIQKPLERGKQLLKEGDFPSAVLCFEAAVKKEPENVEAWLLLGKTQAENEQVLLVCIFLDRIFVEKYFRIQMQYVH